MESAIGIILLVGGLIVGLVLIIIGKIKPDFSIVIILCAIFGGFFFLTKERSVEFKLPGGASFKTTAQQAITDAVQISEIRKRIENQSATVDLIAKKAKDIQESYDQIKKISEDSKKLSIDAKKISEGANKTSNEIADKNRLAENRLKTLNETLQKSYKVLSELEMTSEFTITFLDALNDDRKAFDKLYNWAKDKSNNFSSRAEQAWINILDQHSLPIFYTAAKVPWKEGVDPSKFNIKEIKNIFTEAQPYIKLAIIEYIWNRNDISKKDRMQFLTDILRNDSNLKVVEYAGRYFMQGAGINYKPLLVDLQLKWWNENREKIK